MLERKLRELGEMPCPGVYLALLELAEAVRAELLYGEAPEDGAVDHGAAKGRIGFLAASGEVAHKTSGEGIAGAGGIVGLFERKCGNAEDAVLIDEHGTVFAALHDQRGRPHFEDVAGGAEKIVFVRKLASFGIVDDENIDVLERFAKFPGSALDPVVHGIERDELGALFDLMENAALEIGSDVGEEDVLGGTIGFRQLGIELGEAVELRGDGDAFVEIFRIAAGPKKRLPRRAFETKRIDGTALEDGGVEFGEIVADNGDEIHGSEKAGGHGEVGGGTAHDAVDLAVRAFESVKGYGTDDEKGHSVLLSEGCGLFGSGEWQAKADPSRKKHARDDTFGVRKLCSVIECIWRGWRRDFSWWMQGQV